jgi:hypothetical protein
MMFEEFLFLAATDTNSTAYKVGAAAGGVIGISLMIGLPILFIVSLVKYLTSKKPAWLVGVFGSAIPLLILVCFISYGVFKAINEGSKGGITSVPGTNMSFDMPGHWKNQKDLHDDALIGVGNVLRQEYLIVLDDSKVDFAGDLTDFSKITTDGIMENIERGTISAPKTLTINGLPAIQHEITGTVDHMNVVYFHTSIEGKDQFLQFLCWTIASKKGSAFTEFEKVVNSIEEK